VGIAVDGVIARQPRRRAGAPGRPPRRAPGRSIFDLVHPDDRADARTLIENISETNREVPWTKVRMLDAGGAPIEQEVSVVKIAFGGASALMILGRDLSERRRAEEALQESEGRYQALAAHAPVAIYRLDAEGRCIYLNERWSTLLGIPVEDALGRNWLDLASDEGRPLRRRSGNASSRGPASIERSIRSVGVTAASSTCSRRSRPSGTPAAPSSAGSGRSPTSRT
jgi:PAS domain S-box-containing protein